ncbi:pyruvate kinase isoform X3 [Bicyclus anynana]|uniref:pyruvate kinase n=1 Tax=Bicyclus anynana TaxID=110368 RepID=A0ABM3M7A8_BICAN|nr:pyruvate kinase isoform X3 [Bicyclus anynana]
MSLPWHIPLESLPSLKEKEGPIETTQLKHYCNLNIHENPSEEVQTGLMCEIGMNNREPAVLQRLIASGMTVARLNLRDLEPDSCDHLIQSIRQAVYNYSAELEYVYPLALIVDVRGPDIVTGDLKGGPKTMIELIEHETIRLTTDPSWRECGTAECLFVGYDHLTDLQPGDILFIDSLMSGKVKLVILAVGDDSIECKIVIGGAVGPKMAVRLSKVPRENDSSNKKGRESLDSVSFTRTCHTARQLRFWRGVRAVHYFEVPKNSWILEVEARIHAALDYCKAKRILRAGDAYVVVTSLRRGVGYCDSVRLLYASARDTVLVE